MFIIADQAQDEEHWKMQRRKHLTSSDIFKFLPNDILQQLGWYMEGWFAKDSSGHMHDVEWVRDEVWAQKLEGTQPTFGDPTKVLWGQAEESHFRDRFAEYSGVFVKETHALWGHERWPYLAASLDAYVVRPDDWDGLEREEMFEYPNQVFKAVKDLLPGEKQLLEMKTTSDFGVTQWVKGKRSTKSKIINGRFAPSPPGPPCYYIAQALTECAIRAKSQCILVVQGGISHMTAHTIDFDPAWLTVLDIVNEEVSNKVEGLRLVL